MAERTASSALPNSASTLSPAVPTIRPSCRAISPSMIGVEGLERRLFVGAHESAVALDIGGEDHGEFALDACWFHLRGLPPMEPLRLTVYGTSTRPTIPQCSGTRCVRLPIGGADSRGISLQSILDFPLAAVCPVMARSGSSSPCLATSAPSQDLTLMARMWYVRCWRKERTWSVRGEPADYRAGDEEADNPANGENWGDERTPHIKG